MFRFSRSESPPAPKKARIVDGAAAKAWLAAMSQPGSVGNLAEIAEVLHTLGALGDGAVPLQPERKFAIAERIRGVLLPIVNERGAGARFALLPLDDDYVAHFWAAIDAAVALRDVYAWLVSQLPDVPEPGEPTLPGGVAAGGPVVNGAAGPFVSGVGALQRALDVNAQVLMCIQRARWSVPVSLWERHCVLGQLVRDLDCQDVEVNDVVRVGITRTCRSAFVMPILIALADPSARNTAEFEVVSMAARRWSAKAGFRLERRSDGAAAPVRPVANPGPTVAVGNYVLRFDTQSAMLSIDRRLDALAEGKSPREVGIGDSLRAQAARDLLLLLRQRWGAVSPADIDSPDRLWRASAPGLEVAAVVGMPSDTSPKAAGATKAGRNPYAYQQDRPGVVTRPRVDVEGERIEQLFAGAETWSLAAEASDAVRCIRKYGRPRIGLQRLIGLKLGPHDREAPFLVGWTEALQGSAPESGDQARPGNAHAVRVRLAPGLPQLLHASIDGVDLDCAILLVPGAVAASGGRPRPVTFVPMLSDGIVDPAIQAAADEGWDAVRASPRDYGLILPHAAYRPLRVVKASRRGVPAVLRLEELMMRGADFDLVRFIPL